MKSGKKQRVSKRSRISESGREPHTIIQSASWSAEGDNSTWLEKFYRYEIGAVRMRAIGVLLSVLVCFAYAVFNAVFLGRPERSVAFECPGLSVILSIAIPMVQISLSGSALHIEQAAHTVERWFLEFGVTSLMVVVLWRVISAEVVVFFKTISTPK